MATDLLGRWFTRRAGGTPCRKATPAASFFRPRVEGMEDRVVLASPGSIALPLDVTNVSVVGSQLQAVVELAGQAVDTILIDTATQAVADQAGQEECPILNLAIEEGIHLNLLGLHVDTSAICLDVTANPEGGLLGDLLCDIGNLNLDLGGILDRLNELQVQLDDFLDQLEGLLDGVLGQAAAVTGVFGGDAGTAQQTEEFCNILNLELGPIDLNLLGVHVELDDCAGGPVTVDVTADPEGGLLGQLLCSLADGLGNDGLDLGGLIDRVDRLLDRLFDLTDRLEQLEDAADNIRERVEKIIDRLERLADRVDDLKDLDKFLDRLDRAIDKLDELIDEMA